MRSRGGVGPVQVGAEVAGGLGVEPRLDLLDAPAARDDHAACAHQPDTLSKLAEHFELYVDALNEMSERYIMGFDMQLVADKMLDNFNRYRESHDARALRATRHYAGILRPGEDVFS